jgi:hypothetical protein
MLPKADPSCLIGFVPADFHRPGQWKRRISMTRVTKCVSGGAAASKSPVDLPLRLDDASASPTTPQGQHQ